MHSGIVAILPSLVHSSYSWLKEIRTQLSVILLSLAKGQWPHFSVPVQSCPRLALSAYHVAGQKHPCTSRQQHFGFQIQAQVLFIDFQQQFRGDIIHQEEWALATEFWQAGRTVTVLEDTYLAKSQCTRIVCVWTALCVFEDGETDRCPFSFCRWQELGKRWAKVAGGNLWELWFLLNRALFVNTGLAPG